MRVAILGFLAGVFFLQRQSALPDISAWPVALVGLLLVQLVRPRVTRPVPQACLIVLAAACTTALGFAWAAWRAETRIADELPHAWEGRDIELVGAVSGLPQRTDRGVRFEFDLERVLTPDAVVPRHFSLNWYDEANRKTGETRRSPELAPGERWRFTVRLKRPHGTQNPHGFDFEAWALERSIRATGYVRARGGNIREAEAAPGLAYRIDRLRLSIAQAMNRALGDAPFKGVLIALAIGQQNAIPAEQWRDFWRTGTGHLMSISGLHITMIASLAFWIGFRAWSRIPALALSIPAPRAAAIAGALAALAYALIAGFSVPTQRTLFMLATVALAVGMGWRLAPSRVLALAMLVVLLIDPWAVLAPGFWLSFGAVAFIFLVATSRSGRMGTLQGALRTQWAVTIGLLPITLALFQEVSLISPLANAFAIPLVSLVVVPLTLAGALLALLLDLDGLLPLAHWVMSMVHQALAWLGALDGAIWQSHAPAPWATVVAMLGVPWLLAPRGFPLRSAAPLLFLPMFLVRPPAPAPGELWLDVLDVGQGLASVVRTANHALVYDAGPTWNPDADSGNRIVAPFLRGEGVGKLDALIVTHADDDHSGGARSLIAARKPRRVLTSMDADAEALSGAADVLRCEAGDAWHWDGIDFEILHPLPEDYAKEGGKSNNMGCVLLIRAPGGRILLTADIEQAAEAQLLARHAADPPGLRAEVLLVPHHGSKTSSSEAFLDAVSPKLAIMPVGYRNRFRHPHPAVEARYVERGIALARTDRLGAIHLRIAPDRRLDGPLPVSGYRQARQRYWIDQPDPAASD
ncbi:MAG TPA: DNA internalization-related competence protein ComEC/Rec2 [Usitatibacteraceae bacterium]|nr:DNA internalization-related competence protein ComEC/Rec2 [Usitatibacteraceae bacterium]